MLKITCPNCKCETEVSSKKLESLVTCDSCKTSFVADCVHASDDSGPGFVVMGRFFLLKSIRRVKNCFYLFSFAFFLLCAYLLLPLFFLFLPHSAVDSISRALSSLWPILIWLPPVFLLVADVVLLWAMNEPILKILLDVLLFSSPFVLLFSAPAFPNGIKVLSRVGFFVIIPFIIIELISTGCNAGRILKAARSK